ncbi:MAG: BlaI/MecI/CopY family transcriptional regulator [Bacteroidales bacterium]
MSKRLTKAEEEIMLALWSIGQGTIRDIMEKLNQTDTPYTTVATVVRVLEKKGILAHTAVGTTYLYRPVLKKKDYLKGHLSGIVTKYFDGSFSRLAAFFARESDLSLEELQALMQEMEEDNVRPEPKNQDHG